MNWNAQIVKEWRQLGFYYLKDNKHWYLIGSKEGLLNFTKIIEGYASYIEHETIAAHIHLGWYEYLKIITWHEPVISSDHIGGSLDDLKYLSRLIKQKLEETTIGGVFSIDKDYAPASDFSIKFTVMADVFDPSSLE